MLIVQRLICAADFTYLSLNRFRRFLSSHKLKAEQCVPGIPRRTRSEVKCGCCHETIDLSSDPLSWTLCPSPYKQLEPRPIATAGHRPDIERSGEKLGHEHCPSAFHLSCLAQNWLDSEQRRDSTTKDLLLPLAGVCPVCDSDHGHRTSPKRSRQGLWADVVRSQYRRKEWLEAGQLDFDLLRVARMARKRKKAQEEAEALSDSSDDRDGEGSETDSSDLFSSESDGGDGGRQSKKRSSAKAPVKKKAAAGKAGAKTAAIGSTTRGRPKAKV